MKQIIILMLLLSFSILGMAQDIGELIQRDTSDIEEFIYVFNYENKHLNLVYKEGKYGFTNKKDELIIDYQYESVAWFYSKFVRVKKRINNELTDLLINTSGKEYKVAYKLEDLNSSIEVLDLQKSKLDKIPIELALYPQLKILKLNKNSISELKGIENLIHLEYLDLSDNKLEKIEGLNNLKNLRFLDLSHNINIDFTLDQNDSYLEIRTPTFTKIQGLETLETLEYLYLINNALTKIEGLEKLTNLKILYLSNNKLTKIEGLENLTNLQELDFFSNKLTKIEGLEKLTNLKKLGINYNKLTKTEGLENLTNLQELDLQKNQLTKTEGLKNLTALRNLKLYNNKLTNEQITNLKQKLLNCQIEF